MKTLIVTLICVSLLAAQAQTNTCEPNWGNPITPTASDGQTQTTAVMCFFVAACVSCGIYIVWKVKGCTPDQHAPVQFALEKSYDCATWIGVKTNWFVLNGTNAIDLFQVDIKKDGDTIAFYRARWLKP